MQRYTVYLYPETALHISGGTSIYHQERKQLYLQYLLFIRPLLLTAAIFTVSVSVHPSCFRLQPYLIHGPIFERRKKLLKSYYMSLFSLEISSETFFILRRN
jgi:hypothetical protein